ncbi:hypothetical protein AMAG_16158 [Allomyces macrogynus ATCC 38327]|uniref:SCP domain-containing protein n=1 Tax=Allomyces macrogynus (strain ATCC 38327) TaxID=578462 RepID=A0A0L0TA47_ALLM3|nr:hypothetical protein AMAG_16158 [Allomyces macrogynus ATCC 38327]|eukprot:KNE71596.1 hypothetical protein AMAG_16158 [Allomyces macrogynus ATCC 38327]
MLTCSTPGVSKAMTKSLVHTLTNAVVLALVIATMSGPATAQQAAPPVMLTNIAAPLLALVNAYRASVGSPPVCIVASLTAAAEAHSRDMAANQYFAHNNQNGTSPFDRMLAAGYSFNAAAENIAYGYVSPAAVMQGWIASPGHERNLRNAVYAHMGVGAAVAPCMDGQPGTCIWWTQDFGRSSAPVACVNVQGETTALSTVVAASSSSGATTTTSTVRTVSTTTSTVRTVSMTTSTVRTVSTTATMPTLSITSTATVVIVGSEVPGSTTKALPTTIGAAPPIATSSAGPTVVLTTIVGVGSTPVATRTSTSATTRPASTSTQRTTTATRSSTTRRSTTTVQSTTTTTRRLPTPTRATPAPRSTTTIRTPPRTATTTRNGGGVAELPTEPCD